MANNAVPIKYYDDDIEALRVKCKNEVKIVKNEEILFRKACLLIVVAVMIALVVVICGSFSMQTTTSLYKFASSSSSSSRNSSNNLFGDRSLPVQVSGFCGGRHNPEPTPLPPPPPPVNYFTPVAWTEVVTGIIVAQGEPKKYIATVPATMTPFAKAVYTAGTTDIYMSYAKTKPAVGAGSYTEYQDSGTSSRAYCSLHSQTQDATIYVWIVGTTVGGNTQFDFSTGAIRN